MQLHIRRHYGCVHVHKIPLALMFTLHMTLHASLKNIVFALYLTDILCIFSYYVLYFIVCLLILFAFHSIHILIFPNTTLKNMNNIAYYKII